MASKLCGLCFNSYANLKQHLTVSHTIPNKEEFKLLMKYGNARTTAVLDCPVCDKPALVRLDKHLQDAHYINAEEREPVLKDAKRRAIIKKLVALRLTCPTIRMVSCLDGNSPSDEVNEVMFIGSDSEADGPEVIVPAFASTPQKKDFPPGGRTPSSDVQASSHSFNVPQPSSHGQTSSPSVLATSSSLCNQTSSSSGLGHSRPLPSSPDPKQGDHESPASSREDSSHSDLLIQFQNLSSRLDRIESVLDRLVNAQASTSRTPSTPSTSGTPGKHATPRAQIGTAAGGIPCKLGLSAQKNEHVTKLENPCNLFQRLVSDYQSHRLGPRTARKDLENARQAASHALRFCLYMGAGISPKVTSRDLRFLLQTHKLRTWPLYLAQKGYAPTTVKNMMNNVILFIKHVECNFRSASKLKVADFQKLQYEMKTLQSELHKHVVVHRQKVLKKKTQALPGDGDGGQEHCHLMGYLMGYLTILTGHRSIVLVNMSCENVFQADSWSGGRKYRILVDDHKTVSSFGHAAVCLNRVEYQWLLRLARGQCCPDSLELHHVFHTPLGRQITKPCNFLYSAWANAGMKGSITFGPIRSSVSTQAKTHLSEKERKQVAQSMCHDPLTAEKFYVALPDKNMGYETRNLRLKALKEAAVTSISPDDPGDSLTDDVSVLSDGSSDGKTEMSLDEEVSPKSLPSDEGGTDDATDDAP
ncbi:uncharacterized protein V6R79_016567 [Siganus canaliculatus]